MTVDESVVEDAALEWLAQLGYGRAHGPTIGPGGPDQERESFEQVYLMGRLRDALRRINSDVDADIIEAAIKRLQRADSQSLIDENARVHKLITDGVPRVAASNGVMPCVSKPIEVCTSASAAAMRASVCG